MSPPVKVAKEGMRKSLYIFRRDFRLYDNKGLTAACKNRYFEDLSPTYLSPTSVININVGLSSFQFWSGCWWPYDDDSFKILVVQSSIMLVTFSVESATNIPRLNSEKFFIFEPFVIFENKLRKLWTRLNSRGFMYLPYKWFSRFYWK